jgi:2-isopropylmalate synthase
MLPAGTDLRFEYSPESFTSTELDFALEICEAVTDVWQPTPQSKIILNLPATVEYATPNVHADQIEWMGRHLTRRDLSIISVHTHNDRGTGVAATELALLAGADRVEGTLFGNGERTGNVDIITVAMNMYTQGVDPKLDFRDINGIRDVYERCTHLEVPARQPYAGELVFTAFSGSHQDAIKKSWAAQEPGAPWNVLYIPLDPQDIGRNYRTLIRINSQSGKGGVAYIMEKEYGFQLPKGMQREFGKVINDFCDRTGQEITVPEVYQIFSREFIERTDPVQIHAYTARHNGQEEGEKVVDCVATITLHGLKKEIQGQGNGPIAAFAQALSREDLPPFDILSYSEHSLGRGADSRAVSYIELKTADGTTAYGAGIDTNIEMASIKAVTSALNRTHRKT